MLSRLKGIETFHAPLGAISSIAYQSPVEIDTLGETHLANGLSLQFQQELVRLA